MATGRPTKCTPETIEQFCRMVSRGMPDGWAADALGIARSTVADWKVRGGNGEAPFSDFLEAYTRARHERRTVMLERVIEATETDWKAAKWYLERQEREEFGAKAEPQVIEVHQATRSDVDPDEANERLRLVSGGREE